MTTPSFLKHGLALLPGYHSLLVPPSGHYISVPLLASLHLFQLPNVGVPQGTGVRPHGPVPHTQSLGNIIQQGFKNHS